jgi:lipoate-protein ligase A
MQYFDLTLPSAAANLACDEALLDAGEDGAGGEVLHFWEPEQCFVVA